MMHDDRRELVRPGTQKINSIWHIDNCRDSFLSTEISFELESQKPEKQDGPFFFQEILLVRKTTAEYRTFSVHGSIFLRKLRVQTFERRDAIDHDQVDELSPLQCITAH